jgi:hypothetical protein
MFLSVYPCNDQNVCVDERKAGISVVDTTGHDHSSEEQDHCTPFCICSCCAATIQLSHVTHIVFAPPVHNTGWNSSYSDRPLLSNIKSIWQPPKLS